MMAAAIPALVYALTRVGAGLWIDLLREGEGPRVRGGEAATAASEFD